MKLDRENNLPFLKSAAKALQDENARLRAEAAAAEEAKAKLAAALAALESRHGELELQSVRQQEELALNQEKATKLQDEVTRLEQELQQLKELLELRTRALYGKSSERRSLDKATGQKKEKKPRKERKGHGPTAQPELPRFEVKHKLEDEELICQEVRS